MLGEGANEGDIRKQVNGKEKKEETCDRVTRAGATEKGRESEKRQTASALG